MSTALVNKSGADFTRVGSIQSISIQGTQLFAVIRLEGEPMLDMMGNTVNCGRHLVGLPRYAPESTATMAELLIPININSSVQAVDPKTLIDCRVMVFFTSTGFPEGATIINNSDSRIMTRRELFDLRSRNKDGIIDQLTKKEVKTMSNEASKNLEVIQSEVYDPRFHKGAVGVYGSEQSMFVAAPQHQSQYVDFSSRIDKKYTILDVQKETRQKDCYMPATVFTGRS